MKRLAVFVEGRTELLFIDALITQIAGANKVQIEHRAIRGGTNAPRTFEVLRAAKPETGEQYYVLIVDCGGDGAVASRIMEEHDNLTRLSYSKIIGIRDVRPAFTHADIPRLEAGLRMYIKTKLAPVEFILSVMEIEAWFLAECGHFPRIHTSITLPEIRRQLGFDPENEDMSIRSFPSEDLHQCYVIGGRAYRKGKAKRTVDALDYTSVYVNLPQRIPYLEKLISGLDAFLS